MALSLQQVQRQSLQLIMTPQMQQSIQLLQMNTIELEQMTQAELTENPFLQLEEEKDTDAPKPEPEESGGEDARESGDAGEDSNAPEIPQAVAEGETHPGREDIFSPVEREVEAVARDAGESPAPDAAPNGSKAPALDAPAERAPETLEDHPEHFKDVDLNWDDYYDDAEYHQPARDADEEERDFTEYTAAKESLYDHLMWQLRLSSLEGRDLEIGEYLVGCMDDDGYLPHEIIEEASAKFAVPPADVERVLAILQEFEPNGVAARTPAECLLIQMKTLGSYSETARKVLENHFEELQKKKFRPIARAINIPESVVVDLYHKVSRLEPKPGRAYTKESPQDIEPDVVVKVIEDKLVIYLNEGRSSQLSISRSYRRLLHMQAGALTPEEKAFALEKFRNALMLIKNIEKRKSTILRVTEAIMDVQREFLDKGVEALRPLTLREIADVVGMHESTIARVTSRKYVETPQGLFSLKYFFSSGIAKADGMGDAVSSRAVKDRLAEIISQEDAKRPLSDQKIAQRLKQSGFDIARRTVAKYREQLKILPAKLRRKA